jgi:hypothetical protein
MIVAQTLPMGLETKTASVGSAGGLYLVNGCSGVQPKEVTYTPLLSHPRGLNKGDLRHE